MNAEELGERLLRGEPEGFANLNDVGHGAFTMRDA